MDFFGTRMHQMEGEKVPDDDGSLAVLPRSPFAAAMRVVLSVWWCARARGWEELFSIVPLPP